MSNGVSGVRGSSLQTTPTSQETVYTVKPGDTLSQIARQYGLSYQELARYNNIADPNRIYPGQEIRIPQTPTSPKPTPSIPRTGRTTDTFERVNAEEERKRAAIIGTAVRSHTLQQAPVQTTSTSDSIESINNLHPADQRGILNSPNLNPHLRDRINNLIENARREGLDVQIIVRIQKF